MVERLPADYNNLSTLQNMRTSLDSMNPRPEPRLDTTRTEPSSQLPTNHSSAYSKAPKPPKKQRKPTEGKEVKSYRPIEINISIPEKIALPKLPKLPAAKLHNRLRRIPKKVYLWGGIILVVLLVGWASLIITDKLRKTGTTFFTKNGTAVTELGQEQPTFDTVLPKGKSIADFGGWTRVSPSDRNAVFAYVDHIGKVQINVSEQPLPDAFDGDIENQIGYLAKGYHADVKIDADGTDVYVGTSAKGPQSVIFTKNGLLMLIKSSAKISDDDWAAYVRSLN